LNIFGLVAQPGHVRGEVTHLLLDSSALLRFIEDEIARFFDLVEGVDNSKYAEWWAKHPLGRGLAISDSFVRLSTLTVSLLSAEVLLVVVMYFNVIFGSVTTPHSGQVETKRMEFEWYRYARWVMLAIVSLLISGTVVFFIAFWVYVLITAPDQGLEEHGAMPWHPYLGAYGYVYIVQMVLLSSILIFMCLMGWAQKRIMELPQDPSPYELERKERYAAHVQGLAKARAAAFHARKKSKSKAGDDGGARSTTTASESSKSKEPMRRLPATQAAKVTSRSAKIPSTSGTRSE
jgi:hypothetical protein